MADCVLNPIDSKAASQIATLIEFKYGSTPTIYRYARWTADVTFKGNVYSAVPALEVNYGKQHGGTQDVPAVVKMSKIEPAASMSTAFPVVKVTIWEVQPGNDNTAELTWGGTISRVRFNSSGNPEVLEFDVAGKKSRLNVPLGIVIGNGCWATFGGTGCFKDLTPLKQNGVVSSISGQKIVIAGFSTAQGKETYWRQGSVEFDTLALSIYKHLPLESAFLLVKPPPAYWVGKTVVVSPGCDHSINDCRFWDNEEFFGGIGGDMPDYQPNFEQGAG